MFYSTNLFLDCFVCTKRRTIYSCNILSLNNLLGSEMYKIKMLSWHSYLMCVDSIQNCNNVFWSRFDWQDRLFMIYWVGFPLFFLFVLLLKQEYWDLEENQIYGEEKKFTLELLIIFE